MTPAERSSLALEGLALGDAFGQTFFGPEEEVNQRIESKNIPDGRWHLTDDSIMASAVHDELVEHEEVIQESLIRRFVEKYQLDRSRGYGATMARMLRLVIEGNDWRTIAREAFDGMGSFGNGAAMRVASVGAYFSGDDARITEQARRSAEITHANTDGIAGAIAVAIACGWAASNKAASQTNPSEFLDHVASRTPSSATKDGLCRALELPLSYDPRTAARVLGNGSKLSAQDTVPFALWCAAGSLDCFEMAMWRTVSGLGDRDTTCAIVGGVVALAVGFESLPSDWLKHRESLDQWVGYQS